MNTEALQNKVRTIQAKRNNEEGFTLVELLVVITILGVLAAVVVFSVNGISNNSKSSACKSDVKATEVAIEAYRAQNPSYPATLNVLVPNYIRSLPTGSSDAALVSNGATFVYTSGTGTLVGTCP